MDEFIRLFKSGKISFADLNSFQVLKFRQDTSLNVEVAKLKGLLKNNKLKKYIETGDSESLIGIFDLNPQHNLCVSIMYVNHLSI